LANGGLTVGTSQMPVSVKLVKLHFHFMYHHS